MISLFPCLSLPCDSGSDGQVRLWGSLSRSQPVLQQSCTFIDNEEYGAYVSPKRRGLSLINLCCNANGRVIAASLDHMVNIWFVTGETVYNCLCIQTSEFKVFILELFIAFIFEKIELDVATCVPTQMTYGLNSLKV